ncbi:Protein Networked (NET) actin-binding (NAB) domain [Arabidopsis suecica]|uniref:Protein Networked (NET) actin-binding (NAB) domain n=1 Tax=Arabidopsis suecica TaxID=45249 RepID=A0A8T1ZFC2_ARASU|nr:Protein Networked (NET) actin-binding (NAB) domain [Arabidopsis suecica]
MNETSKWWWIGANHNTSNSSPWLNTTLSDLDAKTKEMLRVIDEVDDEGDSFMKRAKIYFENKPKLIAMVEDLYRSHRSLAQKHDLLIKTSSLNSDSHNSSTCDEIRSELCEETESDGEAESEKDQIVEFGDDGETMKEELERLREENRVYKKMMGEKKQVVTLLLANLVRVCFCVLFASNSIGKYFLITFCVFVYYFLMILWEVGCFKYE